MYAAFNRGDYELVYSVFDPDIEVEIAESVSPLGFGPVLRGREEVISEWRRWMDDWELFRRDPVELVDLGDRMLVLVRQTARNRGSGADLENHVAHVFTLREGSVVHQKEYDEWAAALAAVDLESGPGG
jgi:ketosteroid isomerase-like protein